jgi:GNAT superfamily N-acetyltransferase
VTSHTDLEHGVRRIDRTGREILYRYLQPCDSIDVITDMLHEAYAPLAVQGLKFLATHQDSATTRRRMDAGETMLALDGATIVGTITLREAGQTHGSPFYDRPEVAAFGQYAVRPSYQGCGIGSALLDLVEMRAKEKGVTLLGLDTAENATHLIALYRMKGYRFIEHVQWPDVNYRSVILGKSLA